MSVHAITWAYEQDIPNSSAKFLLVTLANYADGEGVGYPGQGRLARDTGLSERSVRRNLALLEDMGLIRREHRQNKYGHRTSDQFRLIGFASQPDSVTARKRTRATPPTPLVLCDLPATMTARDENQPANVAAPTGQIRPSLPAKLAAIYKELEPLGEPLGEPSDIGADAPSEASTPAAEDAFTTFMALYEIETGEPYISGVTKPPSGLARKLGKVSKELSAMGVNGIHGEEVLRRWPRLQQKYPKATIHALPEHWHSLRDDAWEDYLKHEQPARNGQPPESTIARTQRRLRQQQQPDDAGGDVVDVQFRPAQNGRRGDDLLDTRLPAPPDDRPGRDA